MAAPAAAPAGFNDVAANATDPTEEPAAILTVGFLVCLIIRLTMTQPR